jgi:sorting nexin-4
MDHGDFDSVSWRNELGSDGSRPTTARTSDEEAIRQRRDTNGKRRARAVTPPQTGYSADALDLAGVDDGHLECTVGSPLKENDGSKDAFVSYLVTTHVS